MCSFTLCVVINTLCCRLLGFLASGWVIVFHPSLVCVCIHGHVHVYVHIYEEACENLLLPNYMYNKTLVLAATDQHGYSSGTISLPPCIQMLIKRLLAFSQNGNSQEFSKEVVSYSCFKSIYIDKVLEIMSLLGLYQCVF